MTRLTSFSMKNVAAIMILTVLLVLGGSYAATTLKVESMPDITFPFVAVVTSYPASPQDVMEQVTKPIEKAVSGLKGVKVMESVSVDHFSQVFVQIEQGRSVDDFKKEVESALANVRLPQTAEKPRVITEGFSSSPVYYLSIFSDKLSQDELDAIFKETIEPGFQSLNGIDHLDVIGEQEATLTVRLHADALNTYGLTPSSVANLIRASLAESPVGAVELQDNTEMVRVRGELNQFSQLEDLMLGTPQGLVALKQLGEVVTIYDAKFIARLDGKPAIGVHLYKTKDANEVEFASNVDKLIENWEKTLPDVTVKTVFNGATEIKKSITGMMQEGILGALLAAVMILLFLRNVRMTLIVLVSIPLSLLISLLMMSSLGISLNIMTLGGLVISIGRVVDDSIVVIENIYSQLQKRQESKESVILFATKQVAGAITSSTLATVAVFGPIAFVSGIVGEVFVPFALTLVCALLASLLVAVTIIPLLAKLMVMRGDQTKASEQKPGVLARTYHRTLIWSLKHWIITLGIATVLLVSSIVFIVPQLPVAFMPESDSDRSIYLEVTMPRETPFQVMNEHMLVIEDFMREAKDEQGEPRFTFIESLVGYNWGEDRIAYKSGILAEVNNSGVADETVKDFTGKIEQLLPEGSSVAGQVISFGPPNDASSTIQYSLTGEDPEKLKQAAELVKAKMSEFTELEKVKDSLAESKKEIEIVVDQNKAMQYGLTSYQVIESVNGWIGTQQLGDLSLDATRYQTVVALNPSDIDSLSKIEALQIQTPLGVQVSVGDIANVQEVLASNTIHRSMQERVVTVSAQIVDMDKKGVSNIVTAALDGIELPAGVSREVAGVSDEIDQSFMEMFVAMIASVFIVYLVMVLTFGNASAPFSILFSLPLAIIGGLLGLYVAGETINVTSLIGFLMLIGIVVTNAIVLIYRVQQRREEGDTVHDALVKAGAERLRPILMTAGATIMTLLPLAFGLSSGSVISKGLSVVVIGGLISSTLLTLVVVPIVYERLERIKAFFKKPVKVKEKIGSIEIA